MQAQAEKLTPEEEIADRKEFNLRARYKSDFRFYAKDSLKIRPKQGDLVPLELNKAQLFVHAIAERQLQVKGRVRIILLKGRQQGMSTYVEGRLYWKVTHRKGVYAYILTHEDAATNNLFRMAQRYHDNCIPMLRPVTGSASAKTLDFKMLDSGYAVGTAGTKAVGRSTTPQFFHGSEVAFWPHADTHSTGVMQGVPMMAGTEIWLESTANGMGNYFHAQWQLAERGESDYIAVFIPWFWQDEYEMPVDDDFSLTHDEFELLDLYKKDGLTAEHLNWRRMKIREFTSKGHDGSWKFKQEYPMTSAEAFQTSGEESLIDPKFVVVARKRELAMTGAHVVGCDPARFGPDRTAFIHRNGRKMWGMKHYRKKSITEVAGYCVRLLVDPATGRETDVDMLFIDANGLGGGVYDILVELGHGPEGSGRVTAVESQRRALEDDKYFNKRAEMGVNMRQWFDQPGGVDVPDDDVLQADMCCVQYSYDSAGRWKLEEKDHITNVRSLESPDYFDAASLTFAEPVASPNLKLKKARETVQTISYP